MAFFDENRDIYFGNNIRHKRYSWPVRKHWILSPIWNLIIHRPYLVKIRSPIYSQQLVDFIKVVCLRPSITYVHVVSCFVLRCKFDLDTFFHTCVLLFMLLRVVLHCSNNNSLKGPVRWRSVTFGYLIIVCFIFCCFSVSAVVRS